MILLRSPRPERVRAFHVAQAREPLSYAESGGTRLEAPPAGYGVDRLVTRLGDGRDTFRAARDALLDWKVFDVLASGGVELCNAYVPVAPGSTLVLHARHYGLHSLSAARVLYVVQEDLRFGFAFGTLPGGMLQGEARLLIERLPDDSVWFGVYAFTRPRHPLAVLFAPLARRATRRAFAAMVEAMRTATFSPDARVATQF